MAYGKQHPDCAKDLDTVRRRYAPRHVDYIDWVGQTLLPWGFEPVRNTASTQVLANLMKFEGQTLTQDPG